VKRRYRVRTNAQFQAIRQRGRSVSSELLVLYMLPNQLPYSRFGFSINSRMGNAVTRNRIKRRLRAIVSLQLDALQSGWDLLLIARRPLRSADYRQMEGACARLFRRAHLLKVDNALAGASTAGDNPAHA
jgi:ribonuclease P protein component